jgi:hypothetical protein
MGVSDISQKGCTRVAIKRKENELGEYKLSLSRSAPTLKIMKEMDSGGVGVGIGIRIGAGEGEGSGL